MPDTRKNHDVLAEEYGQLTQGVPADLDGTQLAKTARVEDADLQLMQHAVESYRTETLRWAEERSAAMPVPVVPARTPWLHAPGRWALAPAALVACAASALVYLHQPAAPTAVTIPTAQMLAQDESLLRSVDAALDGTGKMPTEEELGLTKTVDETHTPRHVEEVMN